MVFMFCLKQLTRQLILIRVIWSRISTIIGPFPQQHLQKVHFSLSLLPSRQLLLLPLLANSLVDFLRVTLVFTIIIHSHIVDVLENRAMEQVYLGHGVSWELYDVTYTVGKLEKR